MTSPSIHRAVLRPRMPEPVDGGESEGVRIHASPLLGLPHDASAVASPIAERGRGPSTCRPHPPRRTGSHRARPDGGGDGEGVGGARTARSRSVTDVLIGSATTPRWRCTGGRPGCAMSDRMDCACHRHGPIPVDLHPAGDRSRSAQGRQWLGAPRIRTGSQPASVSRRPPTATSVAPSASSAASSESVDRTWLATRERL